jgi:hypothetical protein
VLIDAPSIDRAGLGSLERRYADVMERDYQPVRNIMAAARGTEVYPVLRGFYEVCIQHGCTSPVREKAGASRSQGNAAMMHVALARIAGNPSAFGALTLSEFRSLWVLNSRTHPQLAPEYDAFVAAHRPLPFEASLNRNVAQPTQVSRIALVLRPAFIAIGITTAGIILIVGFFAIARRLRDPLALIALFAALSVQLVFAFAAIAAVGDGRYTMGMWPNMAVALLFAAAYVCREAAEWAKRRKRIEDHAEQP